MIDSGLFGKSVKDRPEDAVAKGVVETFNFGTGKRDGSQTDPFDLGDRCRYGVFPAFQVSVPAQPDAAYLLEEGSQAADESANREAAPFLNAGGRGQGGRPIGDQYNSTRAVHNLSKHPASAEPPDTRPLPRVYRDCT